MVRVAFGLMAIMFVLIEFPPTVSAQSKAKRILSNIKEDLKDMGKQTIELTREGLRGVVKEAPNAGRDSYQAGKYIIRNSSPNPVKYIQSTRELTEYNRERNIERKRHSDERRKTFDEVKRKYEKRNKERWDRIK